MAVARALQKHRSATVNGPIREGGGGVGFEKRGGGMRKAESIQGNVADWMLLATCEADDLL